MAGKKVDAPGLSDALVGVKLVSDTIVDMLVDDAEWAGSPQKGHRRKLQKIADHLHVLADAGARAAKIPQGVDVRYKEARSHVQRGLDFSHVTSDVASASKTAQKKSFMQECLERKQSKPFCALLPSKLQVDNDFVDLPDNGEEYTPREAITILLQLEKDDPGKSLKHIRTIWSDRGLVPVSEEGLKRRVQKARKLVASGLDCEVHGAFRPWGDTGRTSLACLASLEEWAENSATNDKVLGRTDVVQHLNDTKIERKLAMGFVSSLLLVHAYMYITHR
jgi:hypothetical protein